MHQHHTISLENITAPPLTFCIMAQLFYFISILFICNSVYTSHNNVQGYISLRPQGGWPSHPSISPRPQAGKQMSPAGPKQQQRIKSPAPNFSPQQQLNTSTTASPAGRTQQQRIESPAPSFSPQQQLNTSTTRTSQQPPSTPDYHHQTERMK